MVNRIYNEPTKRHTVNLPQSAVEAARKIGNGNLSRGIVLAIERAEKPEKGEGK